MRKQLSPYRAPSSGDIGSARIISLDFEMSSSNAVQEVEVDLRVHASYQSTRSIATHSSSKQMNLSSCSPGSTNTHRSQSSIRKNIIARNASFDLGHPPSPPPEAIPTSVAPLSLADQYLDTMVQDDRWRQLCLQQ